MAITWGSSKNGVKIGVEVDSMPSVTSATTSVAVDVDVYIYRSANIADSSNNLEWTGGVVTNGSDANINVGGSGTDKIKTLNGESQTLDYGASHTATVSVTFTGIDYAGGTLSVSKTVTYPARPYAVPAAPGAFAVARASDTSHTVSWTMSASVGSPWTTLTIERWDNVTAVWKVVQTLARGTGYGPTALSYNDKTTVAERKYQYRARSSNSAGTSAYVTSAVISTTPNAPSNVVAARSGANIVVTWTDNSTIETGFRIERAENGVWQAGEVAIAANTTTNSYSGLLASATHSFRVAAIAASNATPSTTLYSAKTVSNSVQLLAAPNAPTNLSPSGTYFDRATAKTFTWTHNSVDTSKQTAYELHYRQVGAGTWITTGKVASTVSARVFAANTFTNGLNYEWQVLTWGDYVTAGSAYSATSTFSTSAPPVLSALTPANGAVLNSGILTVGWTYTDAEATPQSRYTGLLEAGTQQIASVDKYGAEKTYTFPVALANNTSYKLTWQVWDSHGLASNVGVNTFTTSFSPPMTPLLLAEWTEDNGSIVLTITNPAVIAPKVATVWNNVYRRINGTGPWILAANQVPLNASVTDYLPVTGTGFNEYMVEAVSATPTTAESVVSVVEVDCPKCAQWFWFNYGPNFSTWARARGNPSLKISHARAKEIRYFAGRQKPVAFTGEPRVHTLDFSAVIEGGPGQDEAAFTGLNETSDVVCYRDAWGRRLFVTVEDINFTQMASTFLEFSAQLTEVDYVG